MPTNGKCMATSVNSIATNAKCIPTSVDSMSTNDKCTPTNAGVLFTSPAMFILKVIGVKMKGLRGFWSQQGLRFRTLPQGSLTSAKGNPTGTERFPFYGYI